MRNDPKLRFLKPLLVAATFSLSLPGYADAPSQSDTTATGATAAAGQTSEAGRPPHRRHQFPISVADLEARAAAMFASLDSNGDGVINPEEFEAGKRGRGAPGEGAPGEKGAKGAHRGFGPPDFPRMEGDQHRWAAEGSDRAARHAAMEAELFEALDKDTDGALSPAEFSELQDVRRNLLKQSAFARLDVNDDGVLDKDEFPPRQISSWDLNGDGEVSRDEMRSQRHNKQQPAG